MTAEPPVVSVLMPTFRQDAFLARAIQSVLDQRMRSWELVVVDDGSPDGTAEVVARYLDDPRIRYSRLPHNAGLGYALNLATRLARGRYLAYLPSDDVVDPLHLSSLVAALDADTGAYLAYASLRWGPDRPGKGRLESATLQGDEAVGREHEALLDPSPDSLLSGNLLALVQVAHRRDATYDVAWPERAVEVSDRIEAEHWLALLERGARFVHTGSVTCEWAHHPDQRHKIIAGDRKLPNAELAEAGGSGLAAYRRYYGIPRDTWLRWRPSYGFRIDERARYGRYAVRRDLPAGDGLRILLVGELGFNPERIMSLEEAGHRLFGLWAPQVEAWDTIGPLAYGNVDDVAFAPGWEREVARIQPDVIYGLLNWQALSSITRVLDARLGIPLVVHFKEGPGFAQQFGVWPLLRRALLESDAQVFINDENRAWYRWALGRDFSDETTLILDGDLPKADVATEGWAPKLSEVDGGVHTVCAGRPYGLSREPFAQLSQADIHVHLYGLQFFGLRRMQSPWVRDGLASGYLHLHDAVEPQDWVRELSRYDAAWTHVFRSGNGGDLRRATWDDINLPARLGTYAIAGLPWIVRDNAGSLVAVEALARRLGVDVAFHTMGDLRDVLGDAALVRERTANMRRVRHELTFDAHTDRLVRFFRDVMARY